MIIIGGEQSPVERVKLATEETNAFEYYAKNVISATVEDAKEVRIPDWIDWPVASVTPIDARGWWVYGATWDQRYIDIDYANRRVRLKKVGNTEVNFRIENADGSGIDMVWKLDILDKLAPLSITIDPSFDANANYHTPFSLRASVDGGDYPYTFKWYRGGSLIRTRDTDPNDPTDKSDRYEIASADWVDENTYRVDAVDRHGTLAASTTITLTVIADPFVFTGQDEVVRIHEGEAYSDFINFTGGKPPYEYMWLHDGQATNQTGATLNLTDVLVADAGKYTLQVEDVRGQTGASPFGFILHVMDLFLLIQAADADTIANTTPSTTSREIDVRFDKAKYTQFNYNLSTVFTRGGAVGPMSGWEVVDHADAFFTIEPGATKDKAKFMPHDFGAGVVTLRTTDGRSDVCTVRADIYALPIFNTVPAVPLLVSDATGSVTKTITATVKNPLTAETYMWQKSADGVTYIDAGPATLTRQFTSLNSESENNTRFRVKAMNQFTDKYGAVYSTVRSQVYATFNGIDLIRSDANPSDPMIPGAMYNILRRQNVTNNAGIVRALNDIGTVIDWPVTTAAEGVTLSKTGFNQSAMVIVDPSAPASSAFAFSAKYSNKNGDREAKFQQDFTYAIVRPTIDKTSYIASAGVEVQVATVTVPDAFKRDAAAFNVTIVPTTAGNYSSRYDKTTGALYITGIKAAPAEAATVRVSYKAPNNSNVLNIDFAATVTAYDSFIIMPTDVDFPRKMNPGTGDLVYMVSAGAADVVSATATPRITDQEWMANPTWDKANNKFTSSPRADLDAWNSGTTKVVFDVVFQIKLADGSTIPETHTVTYNLKPNGRTYVRDSMLLSWYSSKMAQTKQYKITTNAPIDTAYETFDVSMDAAASKLFVLDSKADATTNLTLFSRAPLSAGGDPLRDGGTGVVMFTLYSKDRTVILDQQYVTLVMLELDTHGIFAVTPDKEVFWDIPEFVKKFDMGNGQTSSGYIGAVETSGNIKWVTTAQGEQNYFMGTTTYEDLSSGVTTVRVFMSGKNVATWEVNTHTWPKYIDDGILGNGMAIKKVKETMQSSFLSFDPTMLDVSITVGRPEGMAETDFHVEIRNDFNGLPIGVRCNTTTYTGAAPFVGWYAVKFSPKAYPEITLYERKRAVLVGATTTFNANTFGVTHGNTSTFTVSPEDGKTAIPDNMFTISRDTTIGTMQKAGVNSFSVTGVKAGVTEGVFGIRVTPGMPRWDVPFTLRVF